MHAGFTDHDHVRAFMICRSCDAIAEARTAPPSGALGSSARDAGFRIGRTVLEEEGPCPTCDRAAGAAR